MGHFSWVAPAMNLPLLFFASFLLLSSSSLAFSPSHTFPSCLHEGYTWNISGAYDIVLNLPIPELCQQLCAEDPSCVASTWMSASAPLFPLTCSLFSEVSADQVVPCEECVSGPPECPCTAPGECNILEENIINIVTNVESVEECSQQCSENSLCEVFTYLGEENHFRQTCLLFSSCELFTEECLDCTTGTPQCNICTFDQTQPDGSCSNPCGEDWFVFNNFCYLTLTNNNLAYTDIEVCRAECSSHGGTLASIHSQEENIFLSNLLRPHGQFGALTFIGATKVKGNSTVFEWDDGTAWDFENWEPGRPDGLNSCVAFGSNIYGALPEEWHDVYCNSSGPLWDCILRSLHDFDT